MPRVPNNPLAEPALLSALAQIVHGSPPNTQMALGSPSGTGSEVTYTNSAYALSQGLFPALHLTSGPQTFRRNSRSSYMADVLVHLLYFDRFDEQTMTLDSLRDQIRVDLVRMQANIETYLHANEGVSVNGTAYPVSLTKAVFSGYDTALVKDFPGLALAQRTLDISLSILPYAV